MCWFCAYESDDAYHTLFVCGASEAQRTELVAAIGKISPENLVDKMVTSEAAWNAAPHYIIIVNKMKEEETSRRQANTN